MMAVSWGGHESLVIPKCAGIPKDEFNGDDQEHRYVRLYCGLEEPDYLINDLEQAFDKMKEMKGNILVIGFGFGLCFFRQNTQVIVLGNVQDAGSPHPGCEKACCAGLWLQPDASRKVVSLG